VPSSLWRRLWLIGALVGVIAEPARGGAATVRSSDPADFVALGETALFFASLPAHGRGLWRTDGTAGGTVLVKDLAPGPEPLDISCVAIMNGAAYFTVERDSGRVDPSETDEVVLWRSDGTTEGTVPVKRIAGFRTEFEPRCDITATADTVYFTVFYVTPDWHAALWKSDGSEPGTIEVVEPSGAEGVFDADLTAVNGLVYFRVPTVQTGWEPWRSDGTAGGTFLLRDLTPGSGSMVPRGFRPAGDGVCFSVPGDASQR